MRVWFGGRGFLRRSGAWNSKTFPLKNNQVNLTKFTHVLLFFVCLYRCACIVRLRCSVLLCCIRYRENLATVDSALAKYPDEVRANKARVRDLQSALKVSVQKT